MDKEAVLKAIDEYRTALEKRGTHVSKILLYGSFATGVPHYGSDIDVVVISDDFTGKSRWARVEILADALCDLFEPIEAIAMTPVEWDDGKSLIAEFAKQGEIVYAA